MRAHNCPGDWDWCPCCERAIEEIEYQRTFGWDDLPEHYDGT